MKKHSLFILMILGLLFVFAGSMTFTACGDDDDDDDTVVTDDDDEVACADLTTQAECEDADCYWIMSDDVTGASTYPAAASADDDDDDATGTCSATEPEEVPETATFSGRVLVFGATTDTPVPAPVFLVDNATGETVGDAIQADADGKFSIVIERADTDNDYIGIKVPAFGTGDGATHDTYQFNLKFNSVNETIWTVTESLWGGGPMLAGITQLAGNGVVAGAIYWKNDLGEEEAVGCALASVDVGGDDAYMCLNGMPCATQLETHPLVGYYLVGNIPPGQVTTTASMADVEVGSTTLHVKADAICISNIYVTGSENPTTAECSALYPYVAP